MTEQSSPDLRHIDTWLFDLDNTLYSSRTNLFHQVHERMSSYISLKLEVPMDEARRMQKDTYLRHGTTLIGLMREHNIDPDDYLSYVHDLDLSALQPDVALASALARLPGRKLIYTNGSRRHARNITDRLGITRLFDQVFDIRDGDYIPKPEASSYQKMLEAFALTPRTTCYFEDMVRNLPPAAKMGMTTVWLQSDPEWGHIGLASAEAAKNLSSVHYRTDDLTGFLNTVQIRQKEKT